jgi:hypothetical protein
MRQPDRRGISKVRQVKSMESNSAVCSLLSASKLQLSWFSLLQNYINAIQTRWKRDPEQLILSVVFDNGEQWLCAAVGGRRESWM